VGSIQFWNEKNGIGSDKFGIEVKNATKN